MGLDGVVSVTHSFCPQGISYSEAENGLLSHWFLSIWMTLPRSSLLCDHRGGIGGHVTSWQFYLSINWPCWIIWVPKVTAWGERAHFYSPQTQAYIVYARGYTSTIAFLCSLLFEGRRKKTNRYKHYIWNKMKTKSVKNRDLKTSVCELKRY